MFWQKTILLLGLIAAIGNAAPLVSPAEDFTASENVTASILKRNLKDQSRDGVVFRADSRTPEQIKAAGGFFPKAHINKVAPDASLYNHCSPDLDGFESRSDDAYVSTSAAFDVCIEWHEEKLRGKGPIYEIATYPNLVDCHETLGTHNPLPFEFELAALGEIPFEQVLGWWDNFKKIDGRIVDATYTKNPQYNRAKYDKKNDAGAQYQLAGFPEDDETFKGPPWNAYKSCEKKIRPKPSRRAIDVFLRGVSESLGFRKSRATTPKTTKPNTKKPNTTNPQITPSKTCTAAEKKAGKCKDEKKGACVPTKTTKQFYDEYIKLLKAGKPPKSALPPKRGGKKKQAGKKIGGA